MSTNRILYWCGLIVSLALLSSCVTSTTGGFNVEASEDRALGDYIQLAIGYYDVDDLAGARRNINNALEIDDQNSDAYSVLALLLQREGDLDLAEQNFLRAISLDRDNSRARNNYGALLFSLERFSDAYEQLERVTRDTNYTGRAVAFENLGRSALRIERTEEAANAFERALQINPNLYISALELSLLKFARQDWRGASANYKQYLTIVDIYSIPHNPRSLLAGIQIEGMFQNKELVDNFALLLTTLYQDSPEYQTYRRLMDAN